MRSILPYSDSRATSISPSQFEWKIGLPKVNTRGSLNFPSYLSIICGNYKIFLFTPQVSFLNPRLVSPTYFSFDVLWSHFIIISPIIRRITWVASLSSCIFASCMSAQSCPTLCDPGDYSLPGFSVHGISQERILEWVAILLLRGIFLSQGSNPRFLHFLLWHADSLSLAPWGALYHQCLNNVQRMIGPENSLRMTEEWKIMTSQLFPGEQLRYTSNSQVVLQSTKFKQRIQDNTKMLIQIAWWDQWCLNLIPHPHLPEV